ncbi:MAG: PEP-CTERM sorting domain-containing protein [Leptolyngbyaceae cyanobacterium RM2_2_4]|nr:PEP-CTERM sorting domain-containing protein [Leptolyngbyaceae cyanobacterium SL_5_14]NJO53117.1 PEP-CTERM sorting domain-containing protein [Leptolyngbyaceae cyanobacterium RM2_2_4]
MLTTLNSAPAYAALLDFQFSFVDAATGTPVSGSFQFDDSTEPIVPSNPALAGVFYQNASPSSTITVGDQVFEGGGNSLVVANDFVNPTPLDVFDLLIFDDFVDFDPSNPASSVYTGLFLFDADALATNAPPTAVPASARFASVTVGNTTYSSIDSSTTIKAVTTASVPEPASVLGLLGLAMLGIKFYPKRHG